VVIKPFSLSSRSVSSRCDSASPGSWNCAVPSSALGLGPCSHRVSCRPCSPPVSMRLPAASNSSSSVSLPNSRHNGSSALSYPAILSTHCPRSFAILASNVVLVPWLIRRCQTLPVLPQDRVGHSDRAIDPLTNLSPYSSTCYFQKCLDARAVGGSGQFRNLPVHLVFLTPGTGPCESHIIDTHASPPTSQ